eukprot:5675678-Amphidinium_carterae.2
MCIFKFEHGAALKCIGCHQIEVRGLTTESLEEWLAMPLGMLIRSRDLRKMSFSLRLNSSTDNCTPSPRKN